MAVITKKNEKISAIASLLDNGYSEDEFVDKFKEQYPKDWDKIVKSYEEHERKTKPGKTHPMPEPKQYLKNALKVWLKASRKTYNDIP